MSDDLYLAGRSAGGAAHAVEGPHGPGRAVVARCGATVDADEDSEFALVRRLDGTVRGRARIGRDWAPACGGCVTLLKRDGARVRDTRD